ncbi:MAG: glycosyltransferase [Thermodesulfobacteriota bacterium]
MNTPGLKVDLHVHSKMSDRPSQWILQKLSCPESFTAPAKIYEVARQRGMDLVTISDHNRITGSLEIAHLPNTFVSEEITTYFPEDHCKLHVLALDITEAHHEDISRLRQNVYDLVAYLQQQQIPHVLAHPLFDINHKLTLSHFEKMLLLFTHFERNGARDDYQNRVLESVLKDIGPKDIEWLADKHNIVPTGERPWKKNITGGSDDHSSLNIARMYTVAPGATTKEDFFAAMAQGNTCAAGEPATPKTMAHNLYGIAYQYYKHTFKLDCYVDKEPLLRFVDRALTLPQADPRSKGLLTRLQDFLIARRPSVSFFHDKTPGVADLIQQKGNDFLARHARYQPMLGQRGAMGEEKEGIWFEFVNDVSEQIMRNLADTTLKSLSEAKLFNIFQTIGSAGSVATLVAPYFMAYRLFTKDRRFADECHAQCVGGASAPRAEKAKVALFTDTYHETNGVALTLRMQVDAARKYGKDFTVITCHPEQGGEAVTFSPIGCYQLPEYPDIKLYYPPFLQMLDYCFENGVTQIHASTPGPVGLCALAVARTLDLPLYGTYHTAFPQYAAELTGDNDIEEFMWKAMIWFYNQMDMVYVPSAATGRELAAKGLKEQKIQRYPRGIDTDRFHPNKRNGFWASEYDLDQQSLKLLYVGRISREKNLETLVAAFRRLEASGKNIDLIIVGDGPYKKEMQAALKGSRAFFTGLLTGHRLAQAYASSDLFVFPSTTDTFGNVVLEAQASGIPVIVTDQGGPQENVKPGLTGHVVPALDADAMADAIERLYDNPDEMARMKNAARLYMQGRSFEKNFLRTWDLYKQASQTVEPKTPLEAILPLAS